MKENEASRALRQSEQFRKACDEQSIASDLLQKSTDAVVGKLSAGRFTPAEFQVFLDKDLSGLLGAAAQFMEKTNGLRRAWEDGLVLFTDALESKEEANRKLQKQIDLLRVEKALKSLEPNG